MSLQRCREMIIILHIWKMKNNIYPNTIDVQFKTHVRSNAIKTVLKPLPKVKGRLLSQYEESFIVKSCKLWNVLPPSLTHITSLSCFKLKLKEFMYKVPDEPPIPGYYHQNNNSLTEQHLSTIIQHNFILFYKNLLFFYAKFQCCLYLYTYNVYLPTS